VISYFRCPYPSPPPKESFGPAPLPKGEGRDMPEFQQHHLSPFPKGTPLEQERGKGVRL